LFRPTPIKDFMSRYYLQEPLSALGQRNRFNGLYSWEQLNHLLETQRLNRPRLRVFQAGTEVSESRYSVSSPNGAALDAEGLRGCLADGATLIVDYVDETHPPLSALAATMEQYFEAKVNVNLYASWSDIQGFALHWDAQEAIILQISGRKRWTIHRPTRDNPLRGDIAPPPAPEDRPFRSVDLNSGDLLYIPRGWWHAVRGCGEPSLHLTVSINVNTGVDVLRWAVKAVTEDAGIRRALPFINNEQACEGLAADLRNALQRACTPDLVRRYITSVNLHSLVRPAFNFPDLAFPTGRPTDRNASIRVASSRAIRLRPNPKQGTLEVRHRQFCWSVPQGCQEALSALTDREPWRYEELLEMCPANDQAMLAELIRQFSSKGLIEVRYGEAAPEVSASHGEVA
jgi:hypothetical protein